MLTSACLSDGRIKARNSGIRVSEASIRGPTGHVESQNVWGLRRRWVSGVEAHKGALLAEYKDFLATHRIRKSGFSWKWNFELKVLAHFRKFYLGGKPQDVTFYSPCWTSIQVTSFPMKSWGYPSITVCKRVWSREEMPEVHVCFPACFRVTWTESK